VDVVDDDELAPVSRGGARASALTDQTAVDRAVVLLGKAGRRTWAKLRAGGVGKENRADGARRRENGKRKMRTNRDDEFLDTFARWTESTPGVDRPTRELVTEQIFGIREATQRTIPSKIAMHPAAVELWDKAQHAIGNYLKTTNPTTQVGLDKRFVFSEWNKAARAIEKLGKEGRITIPARARTRPFTDADRVEAKQVLRSIVSNFYLQLKASTRADLVPIINAFLLRNDAFMNSFNAALQCQAPQERNNHLRELGEEFKITFDLSVHKWTPDKPLPIHLLPCVKPVRLVDDEDKPR